MKISSSSDVVERFFSSAKFVFSDYRKALTLFHLTCQLFLAVNRSFWHISIVKQLICGYFLFSSESDRRHQSAFIKKRFLIHQVPPARTADEKKSNQHRKQKIEETRSCNRRVQ